MTSEFYLTSLLITQNTNPTKYPNEFKAIRFGTMHGFEKSIALGQYDVAIDEAKGIMRLFREIFLARAKAYKAEGMEIQENTPEEYEKSCREIRELKKEALKHINDYVDTLETPIPECILFESQYIVPCYWR